LVKDLKDLPSLKVTHGVVCGVWCMCGADRSFECDNVC
jgi:hypothetical protein